MLEHRRSTSDSAVVDAAEDALFILAAQFAVMWQTSHGRPGIDPCATLHGDWLWLTLDQALAPDEWRQPLDDLQRAKVIQSLTKEIDRIYPQLASQVEVLLHCYVGAMEVDVLPERAAIQVRLNLREMPRPLQTNQVAGTCN